MGEPVVSVLFPPRCVGCGDFESHLCPRCEASLEAVGGGCCPAAESRVLGRSWAGAAPLHGAGTRLCRGQERVRARRARQADGGRVQVGRPTGACPSDGSVAAPAFADLAAAAEAGDGPAGRRAGSWSPGCRPMPPPSVSGATTRRNCSPGPWRLARPGASRGRAGAQAGADAAPEGPGQGGPAGQPARRLRPGRTRACSGRAGSRGAGGLILWTTSTPPGPPRRKWPMSWRRGQGYLSMCSLSRGRSPAAARGTTRANRGHTAGSYNGECDPVHHEQGAGQA